MPCQLISYCTIPYHPSRPLQKARAASDRGDPTAVVDSPLSIQVIQARSKVTSQQSKGSSLKKRLRLRGEYSGNLGGLSLPFIRVVRRRWPIAQVPVVLSCRLGIPPPRRRRPHLFLSPLDLRVHVHTSKHISKHISKHTSKHSEAAQKW